jgi:hypothetical protein
MFIGPKITSVFTSRWKALAWSAGVLLTAYCTIPSPDEDGGKSAAVDPTVTAVVGMVLPNSSTQADSHVSPWAPDTPAPGSGK